MCRLAHARVRPSARVEPRSCGGSACTKTCCRRAGRPRRCCRRGLPFVGRAAALSRIEQAFERARSGAVVLRVTGEAGVGKTSLCEEVRRRLRQADPRVLVLSSACSRYPDKPHAPLHEPLARLTDVLSDGRSTPRLTVSASALRLLDRAFPGTVVGLEAKTQGRTALAPEPLEQRWRATAALRAMFAEVAAQQPVVLWLDDYHWADVDTQRLVSSLVAGPDAPRMLLLLSAEPEPGVVHASQPAADDLIELSSLSADESRLLIDELFQRVAAGSSELDAALRPCLPAQGSPLLIQERVRHALLFGDLPDDRPRAVRPGGPSACAAAGFFTPRARDRLRRVRCHAADGVRARRRAHARRVHARGRGADHGGSAAQHDPARRGRARTESLVDRRGGRPRAARAAPAGHSSAAHGCADRARCGARLRSAAAPPGRERRSSTRGRERRAGGAPGLRGAGVSALRRAVHPVRIAEAAGPRRAGPSPAAQDGRSARAMPAGCCSAATVYREAALFASAADALHMRQRSLECLLARWRARTKASTRSASCSARSVSSPPAPRRARSGRCVSTACNRGVFGLAFRERSESQIPASELRKVDVLLAGGAQLSLVDAVRGAELSTRALVAARALGEPQRVARALCAEAWNCVGARGGARAGSLNLARCRARDQRAPRRADARWPAAARAGHDRAVGASRARVQHQPARCRAGVSRQLQPTSAGS